MEYIDKGLDIENLLENANNITDDEKDLLDNFAQEAENILPDLINIVEEDGDRLKGLIYIEQIPILLEKIENLDT